MLVVICGRVLRIKEKASLFPGISNGIPDWYVSEEVMREC